MKIIKHGTELKIEIHFVCTECKCEFEFHLSEARKLALFTGIPEYEIKCPEPFCQKPIRFKP